MSAEGIVKLNYNYPAPEDVGGELTRTNTASNFRSSLACYSQAEIYGLTPKNNDHYKDRPTTALQSLTDSINKATFASKKNNSDLVEYKQVVDSQSRRKIVVAKKLQRQSTSKNKLAQIMDSNIYQTRSALKYRQQSESSLSLLSGSNININCSTDGTSEKRLL